MKKRIMAIVLSAGLLFASVCQPVPVEASNLKLSDWAVPSYSLANNYGIMNWFERDSDFTVPITRAEFCDMVFSVVRSSQWRINQEIDVCKPSPFNDTDRFSVFCLQQLGIAKGVGGDRFDPQGHLTREQAATFMARAAEIMDFTYIPEETEAFIDESEISEWATEAAAVMQESGLIIGTEQGAFLPKQQLTREQAVTILVRFYQKNGCNKSLPILNETGKLTLEDFSDLNGKWSDAGKGVYNVTYHDINHSRIDLRVKNDQILSATYTLLKNGQHFNMMKRNWRDKIPFITGRVYLGNDVFCETAEKEIRLEVSGKTYTIPAETEPGSVNYQTMNGQKVLYYTDKNYNNNYFVSLLEGKELFRIEGDGYVSIIDNHYIITEQTRYSAPTVDAAYSVYKVHDLEGNLVDDKEYTLWGLYWAGIITDW